ncbi:MAG: hypothetical protein ACLQVF_20655 [Isosphaeraceae bacterium]
MMIWIVRVIWSIEVLGVWFIDVMALMPGRGEKISVAFRSAKSRGNLGRSFRAMAAPGNHS